MEELVMATTAGKILGDRSAATARYYESIGRLPAIRAENGTRLFRRSDVHRLAAELATRRGSRRGVGVST
jgi:DNA-binding transcriptional MerR regulator